MTNMIGKVKGKTAPVRASYISITIINNSVIKVNGKYLIRTSGNDWMRQEAVWTAGEIDAAKKIIRDLNKNRKKA